MYRLEVARKRKGDLIEEMDFKGKSPNITHTNEYGI